MSKANEDESFLFEGEGQCERCMKNRVVHLIFHEPARRWRDICRNCAMDTSPYLKPTVERATVKFGKYKI